jgi:signal transduction histidine kinase
VPTLDGVVTETLRSLWREARAPDPPGPAGRDWVLVAAAVGAATVEAIARPEVVWRPVSLVMVVALAFTLPWRRTHPLLMAVLAFGASSLVDAVALAQGIEWEGLSSAIFLLLLPFALTRWGSGREVAAGCGVLAVPLLLTALGGAPAGDVVGGAGVLLLAAALGAGARYQRASREQELDGARAREREVLARELHDTVAHHVSAIAIRAQAGRVLAGASPGAADDALVVIEEEASRTLEEMRSMVGALRDGDRADLAPQRGVADIERLARPADPGGGPRVEVELSGDLAGVRPSVDAALYRMAQEAVTNAIRHARHATTVRVTVRGGGDRIRLAVVDDGRGGGAGASGSGFGLVGMAERANLLGGTFAAGPGAEGGWSVVAVLPRHGAVT